VNRKSELNKGQEWTWIKSRN